MAEMSVSSGNTDPSDFKTQLLDLKESTKKDADHIWRNVFPEKVIQLNKLLQSDMLSLDEANMKAVVAAGALPFDVKGPQHDESSGTASATALKRKIDNGESDTPLKRLKGTPVYEFSCGPVHCNSALDKIAAAIKPLANELMEYTTQLRLWITMCTPKIEDGNNFGVQVQEEVLNEVRGVESDSAAYMEQVTRYHMNRAKLVSKAAKYPHVEDYRRSITELDYRHFMTLRITLVELRNAYLELHDLISKNYDKVKKPKTSHVEHLY